MPFEFGADAGGAADIIYFKQKIPGVIATTCELIGNDEQVPNTLGNYELAVCHRNDEKWGPSVICRLAHYTLEAQLEPGHTMDIASAVPEGSSIAGFLFQEFGRFEVRGRKAGLLLCLGITADELAACRAGGRAEIEKRLRDEDIYPYTDLWRSSVSQ